MSDFLITTDCGADLPEDYLKENDIFCAQLTCTICGETHGGRKPQLPYKEFYSLMRAGNLPKTSQANPDEAKEYMDAATGEYTPALQRFVDSLYLLLNPDMAKEDEILNDILFFTVLLFVAYPLAYFVIKQKRREEEKKNEDFTA